MAVGDQARSGCQVLGEDQGGAAVVGRRVGVDAVAVAEVGLERFAPDHVVGGEILECHQAAVGLYRRYKAFGPRPCVHVVDAFGGHRPQGFGQGRLAQRVARRVRRSIVEQRVAGLRQAGQVFGAQGPVGRHPLRDGEALLGNGDRRLEQLLERELTEPLVRRADALHEAADQGRPAARIAAQHAALGIAQVDAAGDRHRVRFREHCVPLGVHRVHGVGRGVVVDERHDAEVADRRARGQGYLGERRGEQGVHRVAALLQRFEAGARGERVVGDTDGAVPARRDAGVPPVLALGFEVAVVVLPPLCRSQVGVVVCGHGRQRQHEEDQEGGQGRSNHGGVNRPRQARRPHSDRRSRRRSRAPRRWGGPVPASGRSPGRIRGPVVPG